MRLLIIIVVVVLVMALVGWISFNREDGRASVNIETQEIREDTESAMEAGSDLLHKAADDVDPDNADSNDIDSDNTDPDPAPVPGETPTASAPKN